MTTDKSVYQAFQTSLASIRQNLTDISETISTADNHVEIEDDFNEIFDRISTIGTWSQDNIQRIDEGEVLNSFLDQLKDLFTEFDAKLEVVDSQTGVGYGIQYGVGQSAGLKITAIKDGIQVYKIYGSATLTSEDI